MSEKLQDYDFSKRVARHTYSAYLDGAIYRLVRGTDYNTHNGVCAALYTAAKRAGMKMRISTENDGNSIVVQAYKPE